MRSATETSRSMSACVPRPSSIFWRIVVSHFVPTRHGVHLPHDSCS